MSGDLYNIEKILDRRNVNGKFEYKIKWEGYPMDQCTWEPLKNLEMAKALVEEFDSTRPINIDSDSPEKLETSKRSKNNDKDDGVKVSEKDKNQPDEGDDVDENSKILIFENENKYNVDNTLLKVVTVKNQSGKLMALVEKRLEDGKTIRTYISTEELRKINPWILLIFYESKIKFN